MVNLNFLFALITNICVGGNCVHIYIFIYTPDKYISSIYTPDIYIPQTYTPHSTLRKISQDELLHYGHDDRTYPTIILSLPKAFMHMYTCHYVEFEASFLAVMCIICLENSEKKENEYTLLCEFENKEIGIKSLLFEV